ncbi:Protein 21.1 [Giardia lamblia P15]|uniref:Protein 21.1 n=1 Tax=Giardia intestinalis (strain P15) TaxID=658858 RepID=E1F231_GIAIA|nr:Protein 21.1 [Giardia lamblia P15]
MDTSHGFLKAQFKNEMTDGLEAWLTACQLGDLQFVRSNIAKYKTRVNCLSESGLMLAAYFNQLDIVKALLYFEYTLGNSDGYTALMYATCANNLKVCELLIERECCYVLQDGTTALMLAVQCDHLQIVEFLSPYMDFMKDNNNETALFHAIRAGRLVIVKKLIEKSQSIVADDIRAAAAYAQKQNQQAIYLFLKGIENAIPETRPVPSITPRHPKIMRPSPSAPIVKRTKIEEHFAKKIGVLSQLTQGLQVPQSLIKRAASKSATKTISRKPEKHATSCTEETPHAPQVSLEHNSKDIPTNTSSSSSSEAQGWLQRSWGATVNMFYRGLSKTRQALLRVFSRKVVETTATAVSSSISSTLSV